MCQGASYRGWFVSGPADLEEIIEETSGPHSRRLPTVRPERKYWGREGPETFFETPLETDGPRGTLLR